MQTCASPLKRLACAALSGASALMLAVPAGALPAPVLLVAMCHGGTVQIPLGGEQPGPDKQCPGGCHAACTRKRGDEDAD